MGNCDCSGISRKQKEAIIAGNEDYPEDEGLLDMLVDPMTKFEK